MFFHAILCFFQKPILEVLFNLFDFKQPEWTDEISVALEAVNPSRWQDSFRIADGFVAAEVHVLFPHIAKSRLVIYWIEHLLIEHMSVGSVI